MIDRAGVQRAAAVHQEPIRRAVQDGDLLLGERSDQIRLPTGQEKKRLTVGSRESLFFPLFFLLHCQLKIILGLHLLI